MVSSPQRDLLFRTRSLTAAFMLLRAARKRVSHLHPHFPPSTSLLSLLNGIDLHAFKCPHNQRHRRTFSSTSHTSSRRSLKPYYTSDNDNPRTREKEYEVDDDLLFPTGYDEASAAVKHNPQPSDDNGDDNDKPALVGVLSNLLRTLPPSAIARSPRPTPPSPSPSLSPSRSTPKTLGLHNPIWNAPFPPTPPSIRTTLSFLSHLRSTSSSSFPSTPLTSTAHTDWQSYFHTERHIDGFQGRTARSRALVFYYNIPPRAEWREVGRVLGRWGSVTRVWGVVKRRAHPLHRQKQGQEDGEESRVLAETCLRMARESIEHPSLKRKASQVKRRTLEHDAQKLQSRVLRGRPQYLQTLGWG